MDVLQEAHESLENLRVADTNRYDFVEVRSAVLKPTRSI